MKKLLCSLLVLGGCAMDSMENENSVEQDIASPTLTATAVSSTEIDLSWNAVTGADKYYILEGANPGSETYYTTSIGNTYAAGHLTPGTQYCWEVEAVQSNGPSLPSNEVCVSTQGVPAAPTNVVATPTSPSRIQVTWDPVTSAIKYYVYQSTNGGAYTYISTAATNSYTAVNLTTSNNYCYEVQVVTSNGTSAFSAPGCSQTLSGTLEGWWKMNEASGTVAADSSGLNRPGTIVGSVTPEATTLPPVDNDKGAFSFAGGAGDMVSIPSVGAFNLGGGAFTVAAWVKLPSAASGAIHIMGKRAASCGATTWELGQNGNLYFAGPSGSVNFGVALPVGTWTHIAVTRFSGSAALLYVNGVQVASGAVTMGAGSNDALQIGNSGGCGNSGTVIVDEARIYSTALTAQQVSDLGTVPPAPSALTATSSTSYSVVLNWTAVTGAAKYQVYRGTAPGNEVMIASFAAGSPTYTDTHLTANTAYYYVVSDISHGLISPRSGEASATTQPPPSPPTGVTATAVSSTQVNVGWSAVTGATKYYVYQSINGGAYAFKTTVLAPTTTASIGGLTTGTNYCYELTVETPNGTSSMSSPACATTP